MIPARSLFAALLAASAVAPTLARAAAQDFSDSVVKIYSKSDTQDQLFVGSGLLFQKAGKAYVLTSEHVVLHSNKLTHHRIWTAKQGYVAADYVISDWGIGLGLMAVPSMAPASVAALLTADSLRLGPAAALGEGITGYGYPANSQQLIVSKSGKVVNPAQDLPILVEEPTLVEVAGGHAEFGMSGGPAWDDAGDFAGVLSHQRLVGSTPGSWGPGDDPLGNHALLIPGSAAIQWMNRYFADPAHFEVRLGREENFQLQAGYQLLQTLDLDMDWVDNYVPGKSCLEMEPYHVGDSNTLYDNPRGEMAAIAANIRAHAHDGSPHATMFVSARFTAFRVRRSPDDPAFFSPRIVGFKSTEEFLRLFQRPDLEPLAEAEMNDWDDEDQKMVALGNELNKFWGDLSAVGIAGELENDTLNMADAFSKMDSDDTISEEQWAWYKPTDIDALKTRPRFAADWAVLKSKGADVRFGALLDSVRAALAHLTL